MTNLVFDFDGCIANSILAFVNTYKERHYREIQSGAIPYPIAENVRTWNFTDELPQLTNQELIQIFESDRFFDHLAFNSDENGYNFQDLIFSVVESFGVVVNIASKGTKMNLKYKDFFIDDKLRHGQIKYIPMLGLDMDKSSLDYLDPLIAIDDHENNLYSSSARNKILFSMHGIVTDFNSKAMEDDGIIKCFGVAELQDVIYTILKNNNIK